MISDQSSRFKWS